MWFGITETATFSVGSSSPVLDVYFLSSGSSCLTSAHKHRWMVFTRDSSSLLWSVTQNENIFVVAMYLRDYFNPHTNDSTVVSLSLDHVSQVSDVRICILSTVRLFIRDFYFIFLTTLEWHLLCLRNRLVAECHDNNVQMRICIFTSYKVSKPLDPAYDSPGQTDILFHVIS